MSIGDARFFTRSGPHSIATVAEAACGTTPETDLLLTGVAPLQAAGPDQVSFLDNRRYAAALEKTSAGAVIIHPDMFPRVPAGVVPILTVGQHRDIAGLGEVDGGDGFARRVQDLAGGKLDGFEPRPEPGEVVGRQGREQAVAGSGTGSGSGLIGEHRKLLRRGVGGSTGLSLPPAPESRGGRWLTYGYADHDASARNRTDRLGGTDRGHGLIVRFRTIEVGNHSTEPAKPAPQGPVERQSCHRGQSADRPLASRIAPLERVSAPSVRPPAP
jgi:hypothetical protein